MNKFFTDFSNFIAKWTGTHWAFVVACVVVAVALGVIGLEATNIGISVVTLLMLVVLQTTQNRDSAALQLKLDELITHSKGPRDKIAGVESKSHEEIEELRHGNEDRYRSGAA